LPAVERDLPAEDLVLAVEDWVLAEDLWVVACPLVGGRWTRDASARGERSAVEMRTANVARNRDTSEIPQ
jgi:hypothetical protein